MTKKQQEIDYFDLLIRLGEERILKKQLDNLIEKNEKDIQKYYQIVSNDIQQKLQNRGFVAENLEVKSYIRSELIRRNTESKLNAIVKSIENAPDKYKDDFIQLAVDIEEATRSISEKLIKEGLFDPQSWQQEWQTAMDGLRSKLMDKVLKEEVKNTVKRIEEIVAWHKTIKRLNSERAKNAINARHDKPGGSRDKAKQIQAIWATGKYSTRDICAEEEYQALGYKSFGAARRALQNTPDPENHLDATK
jgi:DNA-binding FrmR family transcriptional regulator